MGIHLAVAHLLANILGSTLLGSVFGWKIGLGIFLITYALTPVTSDNDRL